MYLIEGRPKNRAIVELYVRNIMKELKIHRFTRKIVNIEFKRKLDNDAQGLCTGDKEVALVSINKSLPFLRQMIALAHEMVHAKQFLRGELNGDDLKWKWMGTEVVASYESQPWEIEAYLFEKHLFLECFPFDDYNPQREREMVTYSTNWMGPVHINWYKDRGLTIGMCEPSSKNNDWRCYEGITTHYACGRIDIRDSSKGGYDGWDEYSLAPMHGEDWNALSYWLREMQTEEIWPYEKLIQHFQYWYGKEIRWGEEIEFEIPC